MLGREELKEQIEKLKNKAKKINSHTSKAFVKEIQEKIQLINALYDPMIRATKENYEKIKEEKENNIKELEQIENNLGDFKWKL